MSRILPAMTLRVASPKAGGDTTPPGAISGYQINEIFIWNHGEINL
jgi:hypothetical protein